MIPEGSEELAKTKQGLMLEILLRQFISFGPLPTELLEHVNDEEGSKVMKMASEISDGIVSEQPGSRFDEWPNGSMEHLDSGARDLISQMTKLDPATRATIDKVLEHPWWQSDV